MTRIDHTNCNHPRTPAGRRACRASGVAVPAVDYVKQHMHKVQTAHAIRARMDREAIAPIVHVTPDACSVRGTHCEQCGRTDWDATNGGDQGYSGCCNEIVTDAFYCRNHHG